MLPVAGLVALGQHYNATAQLVSHVSSGVISGSYGASNSTLQVALEALGHVTSASVTPIAKAASAVSGMTSAAITDTTNADPIDPSTVDCPVFFVRAGTGCGPSFFTQKGMSSQPPIVPWRWV